MAVLLGLAGCSGGGSPADQAASGQMVLSATPEEMQTLWDLAMTAFRVGEWPTTVDNLERLVLELPPGDPRVIQTHFYLGESYLGLKDQLKAVREFRRVSDEWPNNTLAPVALLRAGDSYAELWRKPELDPSYGQTAMATYQELLNRYPDGDAAARARGRIAELQEWFAVKELKTAMYYLRMKATDSAILYLKGLVADYPRTAAAPDALEKLVEAYRKLGYSDDVEETCGYMRRFHADDAQTAEACPDVPQGS